MMGLSDGRKSFRIGLAVLIQYRSVTDTQPATQPRCRSYYAKRSGVEPKKRMEEEQACEMTSFTNDLHDGLLRKSGRDFWKVEM